VSFQTTALILAWVAIALLGLALSGLLRQLNSLTSAQEIQRFSVGPTVGEPAPPLDGAADWAKRPRVLLFARTGCPGCSEVLPEFAALAQSNEGIDFVSVFPDNAGGYSSPHVRVLTEQPGAFDRYLIPVTPFGVTVDADGVVRDGEPLGSAIALRHLVARAREEMIGS
jgi:thiol-disulfide isomerase/thioredoxin